MLESAHSDLKVKSTNITLQEILMSEIPLQHVRRQDREVSDPAWIADFLRRAPHGVLATDSDGQPFMNPNLFAYDPTPHALYLHTSDEGRTFRNVQVNPRVCFTAYEMGRLLPSPERTGRGFSVEYSSVVVFGRAVILTDPSEMLAGLRLLMEKYFPHLQAGQDYQPLQVDELHGTAVYRIEIESWSAKRKSAPEDFPGAFSI
jgi:nitroimidazol reductase NimA-like FMN-containing flavoprotein (pyridoxamine 5'-phosphate oxidase superfamily)